MGISDLWGVFKSIRELSKHHDEWANVYKQYFICILLMFAIGALRYATECVLSIFVLYVIYNIVSHPSIVNTIMSTSFFKWVAAYLQPPPFLSKLF
jgi:hypothetical protein